MERYTAKKIPEKGNNKGFKKGMKRPEGAGRKPGQKNRNTALLKDAITGAAEQLGMLEPIYRIKEIRERNKIKRVRTDEIIGWKPTGKGGTQGYMIWLGCNHPKVFGSLMSRTLPLQIDAKIDNTNKSVSERFSDTDLNKMTLTEKLAVMREMIGMTKPLLPMLTSDQDASKTIEGEFTEVGDND